ADSQTHTEIQTDHQRVIEAGGFGVPTLFFGEQALFGPVLVDPPHGQDAVRLWELTVGWLEFPHLYEIQRPKGTRDQERIGEVQQPNRDWRGWQRGKRGEVIQQERE